MVAVQNGITSAVSNYSGVNMPAQCIIGWPNFEDLTKIIQQGQYQVSIYDDGKVRDTTRFFPQWMAKSPVNVQMTAAVSGNTITFGGTVQPNLNVWTFFGAPISGVLYQTKFNDTLNTVASGVASAVISGGGSAGASGSVTTVNSTPYVQCNVGGSGVLAREVSRQRRTIQVTVWAADPLTRDAIAETIETYVGAKGSRVSQFLPIGDGTNVWVDYQTSCNRDDKQSDYSMYTRDIFYTMEYGLLQIQTATQIGIAQETWQVDGLTLPTITEA